MVYHINKQHWVGVYADKEIIIYFDPLGDLPNKQLSALLTKLSKTRDLIINNKRVQMREEKVCGIHVVIFFYQMMGIDKRLEDLV